VGEEDETSGAPVIGLGRCNPAALLYRRFVSAFATKILPSFTASALPDAVAELRRGEPVALPTETVYGLAADALNPTAVARIFEAKERPFFDPLICHVPSAAWIEKLTLPIGPAAESLVQRLVERFWPGPLTIVLPRRLDVVPDLVAAGLPTVALRWSAHPVFRAVIEAFGGPLAAPSANRFGRISPTTGAHALAELEGRIPLVIDAGPTDHGLESTIVRPREDGRLEILRPGPITAEMLSEFAVIAPVATTVGVDDIPQAPGQLASHYAPRTPMVLHMGHVALRESTSAGRVGLLAWRRDSIPEELERLFAVAEFLTDRGDAREGAARLFAALRRLDESGVALIAAEPAPNEGLGVAINDRLTRASAAS
jgi:L-threonylcarbamoyladenylate synthase